MDEAKTLNHSKWGVQISCCIHPEIQKEKFVQGVEAEIRSGISRVGETQGLRNRGGSCDGRSCPQCAKKWRHPGKE